MPAIALAVVGNVDAVVPGLLHEVDRLSACTVLRAVLAPVLRVPGRHMQIERLAYHADRHRLNHHRLCVYEPRRLRNRADIDAPVEAGLAGDDRHAAIAGERRSGDGHQRRGAKQSCHGSLLVVASRTALVAASEKSSRARPGHYDIGIEAGAWPAVGRATGFIRENDDVVVGHEPTRGDRHSAFDRACSPTSSRGGLRNNGKVFHPI